MDWWDENQEFAKARTQGRYDSPLWLFKKRLTRVFVDVFLDGDLDLDYPSWGSFSSQRREEAFNRVWYLTGWDEDVLVRADQSYPEGQGAQAERY